MSFRQAALGDVVQQLTREILYAAIRRTSPIVIDQSHALLSAQRALEFCEEFDIVNYNNIKKIAVFIAFSPGFLIEENALVKILKQRSVEEDFRIELMDELGIFNQPTREK